MSKEDGASRRLPELAQLLHEYAIRDGVIPKEAQDIAQYVKSGLAIWEEKGNSTRSYDSAVWLLCDAALTEYHIWLDCEKRRGH